MEELRQYIESLEEKALTEKDKMVVEILKQACNDINGKLSNGLLPLMFAIKLKDTKLINLFINAGADINYEIVLNGKMINSIKYAILLKDKELAKQLKEISIKKTKMQKQLIEAIEKFDKEKAFEYINEGAVLNSSGMKCITTPLIRASELGLTDVVALLLKKGVLPDGMDMMGSTALMWAGRYQGQTKIKVAKLLIDAGADVNAVDREYASTALISWTINSDDNIKYIEILVNNRANVLWKDALGKSASDYAKEVANIDVYNYLKKREKFQIEFNNKVLSLTISRPEERLLSYEKAEVYAWIVNQIRNGIYLSSSLAKILISFAEKNNDLDIVEVCEKAIANIITEKRYMTNKMHAVRKLQSSNKEDET